jgi:hypothetical protein
MAFGVQLSAVSFQQLFLIAESWELIALVNSI